MKENINDLINTYDIEDQFGEADVEDQMKELDLFDERQKMAKSGIIFDHKVQVQKNTFET